MHRPTRLLPLACALVCAGAVAQAGELSVRLVLEGELPFTAGELREAVALRVVVGDDASAYPVAVAPAGADSVRVVLGTKERLVALEGRKGAAAARRVALAVADLANAEAAPGALPPEPRKPPAEASRPTRPLAGSDWQTPRATVGILVGQSTSLGRGLGIDSSIRIAGRLRGGVNAAYLFGTERTSDDVTVGMDLLSLRLGLSWHFAPMGSAFWAFDAGAGVVAAAYLISGGSMTVDASRRAAVVGGSAFLTSRGRFGLFASLILDAFPTRTRFVVRGEETFGIGHAELMAQLGWELRFE